MPKKVENLSLIHIFFNTYLSYESILAMIIGFQFAACLKTAKIEYVNTPHGLDTFFSNLVALLLIRCV